MEPNTQEPYQDSPPSTRPSTPATSSSTKPLPPPPSVPEDTTSSAPDDELGPYREDPSSPVTVSDSASNPLPAPQPQPRQDTRRWGIAYPNPHPQWPPHTARWANTSQAHAHAHAHAQQLPQIPYTDSESRAPTPHSEDDVPLAYLYTSQSYHQHPQAPNTYPYSDSEPYPPYAPPSYTAAVRDAFRDTLIQHIPSTTSSTSSPTSASTSSPIFISELEARWREQRDDEEALLEHESESESPDDIRHNVERLFAAFAVAFMLVVISGCLFGMAVFFREVRRLT